MKAGTLLQVDTTGDAPTGNVLLFELGIALLSKLLRRGQAFRRICGNAGCHDRRGSRKSKVAFKQMWSTGKVYTQYII